MASSAWTVYDQFMLEKSNGTQDLDSDVFAVILMTVSYTPNSASDVSYAGINANEVANGFGYSTGGVIRAATLTKTAGNINFTLLNPTWTAAGGSILCHYAVIKNNTTGGLVAYSQLDTTPDDVTVGDGNTLTIDIATNSVYDESRV